ncbi:MAG: hypothetical protein WDN06_10605 [Asticcacaulis sp.]
MKRIHHPKEIAMSPVNEPTKGMSEADFLAARRELSISLLRKADEFFAWDLQFNAHVTELMQLLVKRVRENPEVLDSSTALREYLDEAAAARMTPGDISGGGWADDLFGTIKEILTGEKDFVKSIIMKILGL